MLEKLAHQDREQIPERTVHVEGSAVCSTLMIAREIMQAPQPGSAKINCLAVSS